MVMNSIPATFTAFAMAVSGAACGGEVSDVTAAPPVVEARVDLTIGSADGADAYIFGRVSGIALGPNGHIYVADAQANAVREFDADGQFVRSVARAGAGPGEVRGPCCLAVDGTGTLWLRDTGNARYNAYDLSGGRPTYRELRRMSHGSAGFWVETTFGPSGHLIDVGHDEGTLTRFHLDSTGTVTKVQRVTSPPADSLSMYTVERTNSAGLPMIAYLYQPFGPNHLVAHSPMGGWASAVSSRYAVEWTGPDSSFSRLLTDDVAGPPLSAAERTAAEERIEADRTRWEVPRGQVPFDVPDTKPPLRALRFSTNGHLWVFLSVPDGATRLGDVYDRDGKRQYRVRWPADVDLRSGHLGDGVVLGVRRDELDVPYIVRLTIPDVM